MSFARNFCNLQGGHCSFFTFSLINILRSKRLNLKLHTASMLEVESGSNDPFSYMLTLIALSLMLEPIHTGSILYMLFAQVVYGILIGILVACIALWILNHFQFVTAGFDAAFVLATALLAYALALVGAIIGKVVQFLFLLVYILAFHPPEPRFHRCLRLLLH